MTPPFTGPSGQDATVDAVDRRPIAAAATSLRSAVGIVAGVLHEKGAIMKIEESIVINRPPNEVFAFFDARANDRRWMGSVSESEWIDADVPTDVGRRGRMVMTMAGRREFVDEVTEYEPGRRVAHRSVSGPVVIRSACAAEPWGSGCRATLTVQPERLPGGVLGKVTEPLTARIARRTFRADLVRLKTILESEAVA